VRAWPGRTLLLGALSLLACGQPGGLELRAVELKPFEAAAISEVEQMLGCSPCTQFELVNRAGVPETWLARSDPYALLTPDAVTRAQLARVVDPERGGERSFVILLHLTPEAERRMRELELNDEVQLLGIVTRGKLVGFVPTSLLRSPLLVGNFRLQPEAERVLRDLGVSADGEPLDPAAFEALIDDVAG
jgi:hypothetical protein